MENVTIDIDQAVEELFRRGQLAWMLKPEQKDIYERIYACTAQKFVINCSRRLGKSYLLCVLADERARKKANCSIKYAAPTQKQVREIVKPLFSKIFLKCPKHLQPKWNNIDSCYIYPNGSKISIAGCDLGKADRLRGTECDLALIDEAGMIEEQLDYIVKDIILPQTLTVKKEDNLDGKIILASTPPKSPAHAFVTYIAEAEASKDKNYVKKTIYDNSSITMETILEYAKESGCVVEEGKIVKYSTTFRREYLAQVITEESSAICPEFSDETEESIVRVVDRPPYYDCYLGMDVGLVDYTAVLFGYWDFANARLIIEDEWVANYKDGINTSIIAEAIKNKEKELWGSKSPYLRIMDNNLIVCQDLRDLHSLPFFPSDKDDKEAAVNKMRLMMHAGRIVIHPRCTTLRAHLKYGIWDKSRRKFERSGEFGHFDAVDALVYLCRNIDEQKNPYPTGYQGLILNQHHIPPAKREETKSEKVWNDLFVPAKKKDTSTEEALSMVFKRRF